MKDFVDTLVAVAMVGVAIAAVVCEIFYQPLWVRISVCENQLAARLDDESRVVEIRGVVFPCFPRRRFDVFRVMAHSRGDEGRTRTYLDVSADDVAAFQDPVSANFQF